MRRLNLLRKEQLNLNPKGPIACVVRMYDIVECLHLDVETLLPNPQYFSSTPAKWHGPALI